jgi:hypothetical protein
MLGIRCAAVLTPPCCWLCMPGPALEMAPSADVWVLGYSDIWIIMDPFPPTPLPVVVPLTLLATLPVVEETTP